MVLAEFDCRAEVLSAAVRKFPSKRVLILGDVMLDRFIWGAVSRISPEAPVPVVDVKRETTCLGGGANVAANVRGLGATPVLLGIVGRDLEGKQLAERLHELGAPSDGLAIDDQRCTTVKTRIIAHNQQVCRADREDRAPMSADIEAKIVARFRRYIGAVDAVIISDYAKGLITPGLLKAVLPAARSAGKIVCVDPKLKNLAAYKPATVITPNTLEVERASGVSITSTRDLLRAGKRILKATGIQHLLITRGEEGMALFEEGSRVICIPTLAREVYDVTGAGDTVISALTLGLVAGLTILEAAVLSNIAAGVVVGKLGTAFVTPEELISRISHQ